MKKNVTKSFSAALLFALLGSFALCLTACPKDTSPTYAIKIIVIRNSTVYTNVFGEPVPTAEEPVRIFICSKAEMDHYFQLAYAEMSSTPIENINSLSHSDIETRLQSDVDRGRINVSRKNEILNALENNQCGIYTEYSERSVGGTVEIRWGITGYYKE